MPKSKDHLTIADVAREADVSQMTVSRVLNNKDGMSEETRQHVLQIMEAMGYRPNRIARSLVTAKTLKIGIVIPSISSAYFGEVLEGAEHIFWNNGYHMLVCNTGQGTKREQTILDLFEEDRVDGVIVFSSHLPADQLSECLRKQRNAIVINADVEVGIAGRVYTDEHKSMRMAVGHLSAAGREHLGYISLDNQSYASRERQLGFEIATETVYGAPGHVIVCERHRWNGGYAAARHLLDAHRELDGLICFNDEIAAGALRACADLGRRVPEDVAVVGYDDIFLAELLTPSLTTMRLRLTKREVGALAARMLLERIEGLPTCDEVLLDHELVVRESAP